MSILEPAPFGVPVPVPGIVSEPYFEGCRNGRLLFQRCTVCRAIGMRPATICSACRGRTLAWEVSHGEGVLYSWTVVWRPQHPAFPVPYAPIIVRVDEGFWLLSAMIGCEPSDLRADLRVGVEFHALSAEITVPYFRPLV
jgi:uncharacterized OB-fold protein